MSVETQRLCVGWLLLLSIKSKLVCSSSLKHRIFIWHRRHSWFKWLRGETLDESHHHWSWMDLPSGIWLFNGLSGYLELTLLVLSLSKSWTSFLMCASFSWRYWKLDLASWYSWFFLFFSYSSIIRALTIWKQKSWGPITAEKCRPKSSPWIPHCSW